jgi:hypothetical protein
MRRFDALYRSFRGVKRAEALSRSPPPPDESVILFDHVVEILDPP